MVSFIFGFIAGVAAVLIILLLSFILRPWLRASLSHAPVSLATIIGMRLRGNTPQLLIDAYLKIIHAGEKTSIATVESVYIANKSQVNDPDTLVQLVRDFEKKQTQNNI